MNLDVKENQMNKDDIMYVVDEHGKRIGRLEEDMEGVKMKNVEQDGLIRSLDSNISNWMKIGGGYVIIVTTAIFGYLFSGGTL